MWASVSALVLFTLLGAFLLALEAVEPFSVDAGFGRHDLFLRALDAVRCSAAVGVCVELCGGDHGVTVRTGVAAGSDMVAAPFVAMAITITLLKRSGTHENTSSSSYT